MSKHKEQTAEQEARDTLERMGVEGAQSFSAGEVVEIANLVAAVRSFTWEDVDRLRNLAPSGLQMYKDFVETHNPQETAYAFLEDLADRIAALLPPREEPE